MNFGAADRYKNEIQSCASLNLVEKRFNSVWRAWPALPSRRARPAQSPFRLPHSDFRISPHSSVTQPSEAFLTFLMYLYRVPRVAL